ncbi:hypothetical protein ACIPYS_08945 [Kitasatospora sp. NPDC089913]|uniref:hypothetical protein n=1 Tax=Kitasatospora sp. NPDC089913 TaxID=3364080 RepID=UPI0037FCC335
MSDQDVFAELCKEYADLATSLDETRRRELVRLTEEVRAGSADLLDLCRAVGYPTSTGTRDGTDGQFAGLPGIRTGASSAPERFGCPGTRCSRSDLRDDRGRPPWCQLFDLPLVATR